MNSFSQITLKIFHVEQLFFLAFLMNSHGLFGYLLLEDAWGVLWMFLAWESFLVCVSHETVIFQVSHPSGSEFKSISCELVC